MSVYFLFCFHFQQSFELSFPNTDMILQINIEAFDKSQKIDINEFGTFVNDHYAFGTDGQCCPKTQISSMVFGSKGKTIALDPALFADLFDPRISKRSIGYLIDDTFILLFMQGSDAAGSYTAGWFLSLQECKRFAPTVGPNISDFNVMLMTPDINIK